MYKYNITINDWHQSLNYVIKKNFLGLQLNHNLNWTKHINYISIKMSKIIGIIYKLKSVFPTAILRSIYNTLLLPHMSYCILSWGSQIDKIRLLQKRLLEM